MSDICSYWSEETNVFLPACSLLSISIRFLPYVAGRTYTEQQMKAPLPPKNKKKLHGKVLYSIHNYHIFATRFLSSNSKHSSTHRALIRTKHGLQKWRAWIDLSNFTWNIIKVENQKEKCGKPFCHCVKPVTKKIEKTVLLFCITSNIENKELRVKVKIARKNGFGVI